jgi:hypothetical protein
MTQKTMPQLATEINNWAVVNFGNTPVTHLRVLSNGFPLPDKVVELNWIAPFFGLAEEISELHTALAANATAEHYIDEVIDAIADIGIYFCDYLARRKTIYDFSELSLAPHSLDLSIPYGKIAHCELKHAQKIRGMGEPNAFNEKHKLACVSFYNTLSDVSLANSSLTIEEIIDRTFQETVSKRDWKKNNATGTAS